MHLEIDYLILIYQRVDTFPEGVELVEVELEVASGLPELEETEVDKVGIMETMITG